MTNKSLKPLKGYNCFYKVIQNGKKIKSKELTSYFVFENQKLSILKSNNTDLIYFGVACSKKTNKSAVYRNRIKRLLRVAIKQVIMTDKDKYKSIKYSIFMLNKRISFVNEIGLNDVLPLVESVLNKAVEYQQKQAQALK